MNISSLVSQVYSVCESVVKTVFSLYFLDGLKLFVLNKKSKKAFPVELSCLKKNTKYNARRYCIKCQGRNAHICSQCSALGPSPDFY